jgi:hypothetical protein
MGSFTSELDLYAIRRFLAPVMGHGALNMVEEGKTINEYIVEYSQEP